MEELKWIEAMLKEINNIELNFRRDYLLKEFAK